MKNKLLKVLVATMLMVSMLGTTCMAAPSDGTLDSETGGTTVEGESTVKNPTYKIVIPTSLDFALDPFKQGGQSQIYSDDFYMINKSNVAVRLDMSMEVIAATGVTMKADETDVTETNTDKLIYMAVQVPAAVTETAAAAADFTTITSKYDGVYYSLSAGTSVTGPVAGTTGALEEADKIVIDTTKAAGSSYADNSSVKVALDATAATACTFALQEADYQEYYTDAAGTTKAEEFKNVAATTDGSTAFRFYGKLNSKAAWAANDVKVTATYTFIGLTPEVYTELIDKEVENSHAYVVEAEAPAFTSPSDQLCVINFTKGSNELALNKIISCKAPFGNNDAFDFTSNLTIGENSITMPDNYPAAFAAENDDGTVLFTITYDKVGGGDDTSANDPADDVTVTVEVRCAE